MNRVNAISTIILFVMGGFVGCKQSGSQHDDFITVDVTTSYPKKKLILQDFMDVEYITLETNDDFIWQVNSRVAIGKDIIIAANYVNDGNIFIFDRNGKGLRIINRKGQGSEEYTNILTITLDEDNYEMFVNNSSAGKILVYDLYGKFKRIFRTKENALYFRIYNYDKENLICHDFYQPHQDPESNRNSFYIVSKQDGSIKEVDIPFKKKISTMVISKDNFLSNTPFNCRIIPFQSSWILTEPSSDTVYRYLSDDSMHPFIVRTPSVHSMDTEVFLFPGVLTDRYYFLQTIKKEFDFVTNSGFPTVGLMYDIQEKAIYNCTVCNGDYTHEKYVDIFRDAVNEEIAFWQGLEACELVESYSKGELKGKLKEIAASLDEESNPVIMLVKYKK